MKPNMIKVDIVDNVKDGMTMADILNSTIPYAKIMYVSTGYFSVSGYGLLRKSLEKYNISLRLLLGKEAVIPNKFPFESYAKMHGGGSDDSILTTKSDLDESGLTVKALEDTSSLLRLLRRDDVQVRMGTRRFNHSKCYVLGDTAAFIGSSNFTAGGMTSNYELNSVRYDPSPVRETQEWFDRMWDGAKDSKGDLITVLEQSKFGIPPDPYTIYMKMLFERYRHMLEADTGDNESASHLTLFQRKAVGNCMAIMSEFGGALVADATGLGKTEIAIEVMRRKAFRENRKKILLIAPSQVLKGMWEARLKDADINIRETLTMEELGRDRILNRLHEFDQIDMVVIDESQNFRSKTANRRKYLMKLLSRGNKKHVLLLSATPINNSLMDLYYQLSIITRGNNAYFYNTFGIPNLYTHIRDSADRDGLQLGLAKIEQLLDGVMVRRTRSYIKEVYNEDTINGNVIRFPKRSYAPIRYSLSGVFGDVFKTLADGISSLTMAPYGMEQYNTELDETEKKKHRTLAHLQVILLLKRFESSRKAIQTSLENKIRLYEYVRRAIDDSKILRVKEFNRIVARWSTAEAGGGELDISIDEKEESLMHEIKSVNLDNLGTNYDVDSLKKDMNSDLTILKRLLAGINKITVDTKLDEVTKAILTDMNVEGITKVIVFTEYAATARYVTQHLKEKMAPRTVECITGSTGKDSRSRYIARFAPKSNLRENAILEDGEIDVLVSTEVLAEGQNLQDCNYVVNYDLPWNPMRIVQRIGRVDRLTSEHDTVYSRACYPDEKLDDLLKLMGNLIGKIDMINRLGLLDTELLDEVPTPKQFDGSIVGRIRALAGGKGSNSLINDMERESDLMPTTSPFNELNRYMKEKSMYWMGQIPIGRRSGKWGDGQKAVLMYMDAKRHSYFVIYDYRDQKAKIPAEDEAISLISCNSDEPRHLPMDGPEWKESFKLLLSIDPTARKAIFKKINDPITDTMQGGRQDTHTKNVADIEKIVIDEVENIPEKSAEEILRIMESDDTRAWDDNIKDLVSEYRQSGDARALVEGVRNIGRRIGIAKKLPQDNVSIGKPVLRLIGAIFVTDDRFDPNLGVTGLKKYSL